MEQNVIQRPTERSCWVHDDCDAADDAARKLGFSSGDHHCVVDGCAGCFAHALKSRATAVDD